MFNRFKTAPGPVRLTAIRPAHVNFSRTILGSFIATARHALMIVGISAITAWGVLFVRPDLAEHLKAFSPFTTVVAQQPVAVIAPPLSSLMDAPSREFAQPRAEDAALPTNEEVKLVGTPIEQQRVTYWLSKRYRVAGDATNMLVSAAYLTAKDIKLDPLLILSVMAIESGFNPFAESPVGAQGLMQVMSKLHHEKFQELGGVKAALNPVANIKVGSLILKDYVTRGGSVEAGLKLYVGAAAFENDMGYGARVLAEFHRLKDVAAGKKIPIFTIPTSTASVKPPPASPKLDLPEEAGLSPLPQPQFVTGVNNKSTQFAAL